MLCCVASCEFAVKAEDLEVKSPQFSFFSADGCVVLFVACCFEGCVCVSVKPKGARERERVAEKEFLRLPRGLREDCAFDHGKEERD